MKKISFLVTSVVLILVTSMLLTKDISWSSTGQIAISTDGKSTISNTINELAFRVSLPYIVHKYNHDGSISVDDGIVSVAHDNKCSLIEAIENANDSTTGQPHSDCPPGNPNGADTISLPHDSDFALVSVHNNEQGANGLPVITSTIIVNGNGSKIHRNGNDSFRIITVGEVGTLNLSNVLISGGKEDRGGGIYNSGISNLDNCTVSHNVAKFSGGGVDNRGSLVMSNSTIASNSADGYSGGGLYNTGNVGIDNSIITTNRASNGGGIYNSGGTTLSISHSEISQNYSNRGGGGIFNAGIAELLYSAIGENRTDDVGGGIYNIHGTVILKYSELSGNSAYLGGGGINNADKITVLNSTFSGNINQVYGGAAIRNNGIGAVVDINFGTITNNTDPMGGSIRNNVGVITIRNSIVANQALGVDCSSDNIFSEGYNIESGNTCAFTNTGDRQDVTEEQLELTPLKNNGGNTKTHQLASGSVAIDTIPPEVNGCGTNVLDDQRGYVRPRDGNQDENFACDIGSFER